MLGQFLNFHSALAQTDRPNGASASAPQKWEYCTLLVVSYGKSVKTASTVASITYYLPSGCKNEAFEAKGDNSYCEALGKAWGKLGEEGWQMIDKPENNSYYFTRPKQ